MDEEVIALCSAMNTVKGIETIESCCGHGERPFHIWFWADDLECLPGLLYWFDGYNSGCYGWQVIVHTDCAMSPVTFMVEGPVGEQAYDDAWQIAKRIKDWINESK